MEEIKRVEELPKKPNVHDLREIPLPKPALEAAPPVKASPAPPIKTDPWRPPIARPVSALPVPSRPPVAVLESSSEEESVDGTEVSPI